MNCVIKPLQSKGVHLLMAVELSTSLSVFIVEERNDDLSTEKEAFSLSECR
jgi:hypothetical protein